jgi:hypothetical protein
MYTIQGDEEETDSIVNQVDGKEIYERSSTMIIKDEIDSKKVQLKEIV